MGKDKFIELMRIGIGYNRQNGTFFINDLDRLEQVKAVLSEILREEVTFAQTCSICGIVFSCHECHFYDACGTRDIPLYCVCPTCYAKPSLFATYLEKSKQLLESVMRKTE